jgi:transposase InsO family protein
MHERKQLVYRVLEDQLTIAAAAREAGVSRQTAQLWVQRGRAGGLEQLAEKSRAPRRRTRRTAPEVEAEVLEFKRQHPVWGAKKIVARLWPGTVVGQSGPPSPVTVRTVDRILARHDLVQRRVARQKVWRRFERAASNELWQMDFKGMGRGGPGYWPLTIMDDHSRYCLCFAPVEQQTSALVMAELWRVFGEVGLPEVILTDNGSCFSGTWGDGISWLESQLWLLGIGTRQGAPYHPQTQGKVERLHRTAEEELQGGLRQATAELARPLYERVIHTYNWERPHESLQMRVPGNVYVVSPRRRPARVPAHEIPAGALKRKVQPNGDICYGGNVYRISKGLAGQWVELREFNATVTAHFAGRELGHLDQRRKRVITARAARQARAASSEEPPTCI